MKLFSVKNEIQKVPPKCYYLSNVNINYSFETLQKLAEELGAKLLNGDILIVDNENSNKRKAFKKTEHGAVIIYAALKKVKFEPLKINKKHIVLDQTMLLDVFERE